jgi:hypothetical protein
MLLVAPSPRRDVTALLHAWGEGDQAALDDGAWLKRELADA